MRNLCNEALKTNHPGWFSHFSRSRSIGTFEVPYALVRRRRSLCTYKYQLSDLSSLLKKKRGATKAENQPGGLVFNKRPKKATVTFQLRNQPGWLVLWLLVHFYETVSCANRPRNQPPWLVLGRCQIRVKKKTIFQ